EGPHSNMSVDLLVLDPHSRRRATSARMAAMKARTPDLAAMPRARDAFKTVQDVGLSLPDVEATIRYDGSPILKAGGCFMAAVASAPLAGPGAPARCSD